MTNAREDILSKLRATLSKPELRFPPLSTPPLTRATRMTVTRATGSRLDLAHRFGQELETLHGSYEVADSATEARLALINRLIAWMELEEKERKGAVIRTGQEKSVLAWEPAQLPIENLGPALEDVGLTLVAPHRLNDEATREAVRHIRFGITGVSAAFAATGSMLMLTGPGTNRAASLLPYRHIALIPLSRLYPTIEHWLAEQREDDQLVEAYRSRANVTLITGPSKSADIEMALTLGVHGPKFVHAILFDDSPVDFDDQIRPSDLFEEEPDHLQDGRQTGNQADQQNGGFDPEADDFA